MMRTAAIFLAITRMGVLPSVSDSSGRPFAGNRAMPFHPAVGVPRPVTVAPRAGLHARSGGHLHPHRLRHRGSGFGLWPSYDGYYPPESYTAPYAEPPYLPSEGAAPVYQPHAYPPSEPAAEIKVINVIPYRPGCDTQIELPWKEGSEKTIRIVRC
jgi:hypothetical protein